MYLWTLKLRQKVSKMSKIRIFIVDDHPLFRKGIRLYLENQSDIEVLNEFSDGEKLIEFMENNEVQVDVIVMDLQMPVIDGKTASKVILERFKEIKILVLTSYGSWDQVYALLNIGASGYLLKDAKPDELIIAIKAIHAGGTYLCQKISKELLNRIQKRELPTNKHQIETLSEREMDVLKRIGQGFGNAEISDQLHISMNTVKTHVANIFQKLNVSSRTQAAFYALQEGLI